MSKTTNERLLHNLEILSLLRKFFEKYPDQRFLQGLFNLDFNAPNGFYEESSETLRALKTYLKNALGEDF